MKKKNKKYKIIIEPTSTGYSAYFKEFPVYTTGSDIPELLKNLHEAFELYQETMDKDATVH